MPWVQVPALRSEYERPPPSPRAASRSRPSSMSARAVCRPPPRNVSGAAPTRTPAWAAASRIVAHPPATSPVASPCRRACRRRSRPCDTAAWAAGGVRTRTTLDRRVGEDLVDGRRRGSRPSLRALEPAQDRGRHTQRARSTGTSRAARQVEVGDVAAADDRDPRRANHPSRRARRGPAHATTRYCEAVAGRLDRRSVDVVELDDQPLRPIRSPRRRRRQAPDRPSRCPPAH